MRRPSALITGIAGFAGSYLAEELVASGFDVSGTLLKNESTRNLGSVKANIRLATLDILNQSKSEALVRRLKPDYVFHLAAIASVGQSFDKEDQTFQVNFHGTLNMLRATQQPVKLKKFLYVSSCDAYGVVSKTGSPIAESQPLRPISPYGISKAAAEFACQYYYRRYRVPVVIVRAFNHSGPRQTESFVIPSFARQIALIEAKRQPPILKVGDLSAKRDFSDVRDVVGGYRLIAEQVEPGEIVHICSGKAVSIKRVLDMLLQLSTARISVQVDRGRLRKADIPVLRGSNRQLRLRTGWSPHYQLAQTLSDTLNYWRREVAAHGTISKRRS
ncbi:MAG: GDP-mannose 4,6-dehydratase [Candidatus Zixiibacteriota bacterium]